MAGNPRWNERSHNFARRDGEAEDAFLVARRTEAAGSRWEQGKRSGAGVPATRRRSGERMGASRRTSRTEIDPPRRDEGRLAASERRERKRCVRCAEAEMEENEASKVKLTRKGNAVPRQNG